MSKLFCSTEVGPAVYPLLHPAPSNAVSFKKWCSVANDQLMFAGIPQVIIATQTWYIIQYTLYIIHCTLYYALYTLHIIQLVRYTIYFMQYAEYMTKLFIETSLLFKLIKFYSCDTVLHIRYEFKLVSLNYILITSLSTLLIVIIVH